jgi:CarD family transcriptional regulator
MIESGWNLEDVMFKVGDLAVYPAHGVGRIECVESKEIGGKKQDFYIMRMMENDMKIMIPIQNAEAVGLRQLIADAEIPKVYSILQTRKISVDGATWNRRYREYMEKIKTGSIYELAEVLRDLCLLKVDKDLSFGERKMLDTARNLLVREISIAQGVSEDKVEQDIFQILTH